MRADFGGWLTSSMRSHGLSQAALARSVGVADAQVSRWRRGQVVPSVRYLQRLAETFGVDRATLDRLAGYPVPHAVAEEPSADPARDAEEQLLVGRLRQAMVSLPRPAWGAYVEACTAVAAALTTAQHAEPAHADPRPLGFGPAESGKEVRREP